MMLIKKTDINKLAPVSADLSQLSDALKNDVAKKMYIIPISKILKIKYLIKY